MKQQNSVNWTEPALCHYNYNMTKSWFVWFDYTDPISKKVYRKQYRNGINYTKNKTARIKEGNALCEFLKEKLKSGWSPVNKKERSADDPLTIKDAIEKIVQLKKSSLKKKSVDNYEDITNMFLKWAKAKNIDTIPLSDFTDQIAQSYMDYLLLERKVNGKTHNGQLGILKAIVNAMIGNKKGKRGRWAHLISSNPFDAVETLPETIGKNIAYTEEEAKALMQWYKVRDIRIYYAASIMFHCYIRKTELSELQVKHINWTERTIIVNGDSAKNRNQDSVTIPEGLLPILQEMKLHKYPPHYYIFGKGMETTEEKICKADVISDRHLAAVNDIRKPKTYKITQPSTRAKQTALSQFRYEMEAEYELIKNLSEDKTFYSWKHTGVVLYWPHVKDVYYMMRQLRHGDMKTTMIYLKSLGLMPNEAFKNATISVG